jgi:ubiquinone/menaquinone biosynthesis C-methylase UbiE
MSKSQYIFNNSQNSQEFERLQSVEKVFDPTTYKRLQATGITTGWRCLEVGAGAGSIAKWMAATVGESGKVVAVDLDTRFLSNVKLLNVEVIEADIQNILLEHQSFDLVHARYVLIHILDFQVALSKMLDLLKPGGWLLIEEPDFSAARAIFGEEAICQSMNRVNRAIFQMFANRGLDFALGVKLPAIFQKLGLQQLSVENDAPISAGGSGLAKMMKMSAVQLADKYIATGEASQEDIDNYCLFADDLKTWAIYYATVGIIAQKPVV